MRQEVSATEGSSTPASPDLQRADAGAGQESPLLPQLRHGDINEPQDGLSYGEGCLVLQSLIIFGAKSMLRIIYDEHNPSKVDGSFSIIANVGLVSLLGLCGLSYIPIFNFINSSNTFYLIGKYVFSKFNL